MSDLLIGATAVRMDEPCLGLTEQNMQSPDSKGWRRYQMIKVMRGDRPAEFRRDLGKVKQFKAIQFNIPGGAMDGGRYYVEHTVGELVDIADELRATVEIPRHAAEASDLVKGYHDEMAQRPLRRVKRSSFGPLNRIQRS